jgi:D-alanine-D-alanine ligase-like ATP-grasp enzyme
MLRVSESLPDIAVLRGGDVDYKASLQEGAEVLASLVKIGYSPVDVLISRDGGWTARGIPTDAHKIYSESHTIVDTTRMKGKEYQVLAKKMGIALIFSHGNTMNLNREDLYKILRQQQVKVPHTLVIRAHDELKPDVFRDIWTKFHTPLLVRALVRHDEAPSRVVAKFHDLEAVVREYHGKGIDAHIMTYRKLPTTSIAVLPNFRGEEMYTPLWVDSFQDVDTLPGKDSHLRPHLQAPEFRKDHIKNLAKKVYKALGFKHPVCIDFIYHNNEYIVVNVEQNPSLRKDGRFMQSLNTTGVDAGHYIHEHIKHEWNG